MSKAWAAGAVTAIKANEVPNMANACRRSKSSEVGASFSGSSPDLGTALRDVDILDVTAEGTAIWKPDAVDAHMARRSDWAKCLIVMAEGVESEVFGIYGSTRDTVLQ